MVDGLKVNHGPNIVIEETRSQPGSRRNSSLGPEEVPQRRASNVGINHQSKEAEPQMAGRRPSRTEAASSTRPRIHQRLSP